MTAEELIQKIITEDLKLPISFEVIEQDARFAAWDAWQAAQDGTETALSASLDNAGFGSYGIF